MDAIDPGVQLYIFKYAELIYGTATLSITCIFKMWPIIYNISVMDVADCGNKSTTSTTTPQTSATIHAKQIKQRQACIWYKSDKMTKLTYIISQILKIFVIGSVARVINEFNILEIIQLDAKISKIDWTDTDIWGKSLLRAPDGKWLPSWIFTWLVRQIFLVNLMKSSGQIWCLYH